MHRKKGLRRRSSLGGGKPKSDAAENSESSSRKQSSVEKSKPSKTSRKEKSTPSQSSVDGLMRTVVRMKVMHRDGTSVVDRKGLHILDPRHQLEDRLPAEHCHEALVSRADVRQRTDEDRQKIFVEENMVMLSAEQNLNLPKQVKYAARQYLVAYYGEERIQAFLDSIKWREPLERMTYAPE